MTWRRFTCWNIGNTAHSTGSRNNFPPVQTRRFEHKAAFCQKGHLDKYRRVNTVASKNSAALILQLHVCTVTYMCNDLNSKLYDVTEEQQQQQKKNAWGRVIVEIEQLSLSFWSCFLSVTPLWWKWIHFRLVLQHQTKTQRVNEGRILLAVLI